MWQDVYFSSVIERIYFSYVIENVYFSYVIGNVYFGYVIEPNSIVTEDVYFSSVIKKKNVYFQQCDRERLFWLCYRGRLFHQGDRERSF